MSPLARLSAHTLSAGYFLAVTGGSPVLGIAWLDAIPALAFLMALLGLVWLLNAFNFMDGIDGLAASEAAVVSAGLALVAGISGGAAATEVCAVLLVASSAGFLWWNWPPARIFMGDVGSGFLGVTLGMLALLAVREAKVPVWVPVILGGSFMVDASVTLLRRVARGGKWYLPHRTHAYQWLSRRWGAHLPVVILVLAINVAWLLPLALIAQQRPNMAGVLTLVAYVPLVGLALKAGSGRAEDREH
jgi:Fuc2NAc and GlcNAc transferase